MYYVYDMIQGESRSSLSITRLSSSLTRAHSLCVGTNESEEPIINYIARLEEQNIEISLAQTSPDGG